MAPAQSYQLITTYSITPGGTATPVESILIPTLGGGVAITTLFPIIRPVSAVEKSSGENKKYYYFYNSSEKVMFITDKTGYDTYIGYA